MFTINAGFHLTPTYPYTLQNRICLNRCMTMLFFHIFFEISSSFFIFSVNSSIFVWMEWMTFENSTSFFPVGSLNPQSSLYSHGIAGQFTLHPIVITISTCGISDNSLEYCVFPCLFDTCLSLNVRHLDWFVVLFLFQRNSFQIHLKKGVLTMLPQFDYDTNYVRR